MSDEIRADVTVVTPENFSSYVDEKLGIVPESPEAVAEKELAELEAKKADAEEAKKIDEDPSHDLGDQVPEEKKGKLNKRFSELTAARKEAEERADNASKALKEATERAERVEREARELKEKYEPPRKVDQDPEPQPEQFTDIGEYSKALKDWSADNALREREKADLESRQRQEQEKIVQSWKDRQEAVKASIPDYQDVLNASTAQVSDQIKEAIVESDIGPEILYHLAKNPDIVDGLNKLPLGKALVQFGKIEASLAKEDKQQTSVNTPVVEISKAPAPISPIRGANSPATNQIDSKGEFVGTFEQYKALRLAGKIK